MKRTVRLGLFLLAVFAVALPGASAQGEMGDTDGIPAYSVARVRVLEGSVWVLPPGAGDWAEFPSNSPLSAGSRVSIPEDSEAELQFHGGQFVLLTSGTDVDVRDLGEDLSSFLLRAGEIRFDLPAGDFAPVTVGAPAESRIRFSEPGRYWLTVTDAGETHLAVRSGRATLARNGGEYRIGAGQQAVIGEEVRISDLAGAEEEPSGPPPPAETADALRADVPPTVYGELADYGDWVYAPSYGYVWQPRVAPGWAPYVYGQWSWIDPYGWTWVSYEPWGWYPYRCGYWMTVSSLGWVWYPARAFVSVGFVFGSYHHYYHGATYRPATVRFVREGNRLRWVPLRPGERYRRVEFRRGDPDLARWKRPLPANRVFVRSGPKSHQWREWSQVRNERRAQIRRKIAGTARPDRREVRPEMRQGKGPPAARQERPKVERRGRRTQGAPALERKPSGAAGRRPPERAPAMNTTGPSERGGHAVKEVRPKRGIAAPRETPAGRGVGRENARQPAVAPAPPPRSPREEVKRPARTPPTRTVTPPPAQSHEAPTRLWSAPARSETRAPAHESAPARPVEERRPVRVAPQERAPSAQPQERGQREISVDRSPNRTDEEGPRGRGFGGDRTEGGGRGR